jgi:hypothetical protein
MGRAERDWHRRGAPARTPLARARIELVCWSCTPHNPFDVPNVARGSDWYGAQTIVPVQTGRRVSARSSGSDRSRDPRLANTANTASLGSRAASPAFVLAQAFCRPRLRVAACVRLRKRSSPGSLPTSWLLRTSTGSLDDGADTAALLLAAGVNLANGGVDTARRRRQSAASPGRTRSHCRVGRRDSCRSKRAAWSGSIWCRETAVASDPETSSSVQGRVAFCCRSTKAEGIRGRWRLQLFGSGCLPADAGPANGRAIETPLSRPGARAVAMPPKPKGSHRRDAPVSQLGL